MRVVVTGSTGAVGRRVCARLAADGHDVVGLDRRSSVPPAPGVEIRVVDLAVAEAADAGGPALDPEAEKLAYEMDGWAADEQSAFSELLGRLGIPHEFDAEGDLLVLVADEESVESALDAFQAGADDRPELEGLGANRLLSDSPA